jgi:tetratricopeptide (TPR) repeat protein
VDALTSSWAGRISRRTLKRWCFRLVAVLLPVLVLAILEGALRLGDVGASLSLFEAVDRGESRLGSRLNPQADEPYFGRFDLGGPEPRRFELEPPTGTYRIVVVGGSTVFGFPFPPELAFPRQLEEQLNRQFPDRTFEVLNAGMIAINSFSVADVVEQCVAAKPNLIVVHTGHNEFYGPGGAASTAIMAPPSLYPIAVRARRLRLIQLLNGWMVSGQDRPELMETLPESIEIRLDDPIVDRARHSYRMNLRKMVRCAREAGIPVLLTTVASNLRDHSPGGAFLPEKLSEVELARWSAAFDSGRRKAAENSFDEALTFFAEVEQIDTRSALLAYRKAQCLEELGRWDEARETFRTARDLDGCRFRAPDDFRSIVAEESEGPDTYFLDIAARLEELSGQAAPGHDYFLEHVHYNFSGHYEVGRLVATLVTTEILGGNWRADQSLTQGGMSMQLGVLPEDHLAATSIAFEVFSVAPMSNVFDVNRHRRFLFGRIQELFSQLPADRQEAFAALSTREMAEDLLRHLADWHLTHGATSFALELSEILAQRRPWDTVALRQLAESLQRNGQTSDGQTSEAVDEVCRRILDLDPSDQRDAELMSGNQDAMRRKPLPISGR